MCMSMTVIVHGDGDGKWDEMSSCVAILRCHNAALKEFSMCRGGIIGLFGCHLGQYSTHGDLMAKHIMGGEYRSCTANLCKYLHIGIFMNGG